MTKMVDSLRVKISNFEGPYTRTVLM